MAISLVSFSFSRVAQPEARGPTLCWMLFSLPHLVTNGSGLQTHWGSQGPLLSASGFLYHILTLTHHLLQLTGFLSSPSYIIVQSPTQSLEWHVWSSSSENNCHAVHRSLSSGASVNECTMGFLPCPILSAKPVYGISSHNCHRNVSLPSGVSLWKGMFGRVEGQYTTLTEPPLACSDRTKCTSRDENQTPSPYDIVWGITTDSDTMPLFSFSHTFRLNVEVYIKGLEEIELPGSKGQLLEGNRTLRHATKGGFCFGSQKISSTSSSLISVRLIPQIAIALNII